MVIFVDTTTRNRVELRGLSLSKLKLADSATTKEQLMRYPKDISNLEF